MSFRLFIYYCALCGGWAAFFGWMFGQWLAPSDESVLRAGVKGLFLGLMIALGLGLVDALWNLSLRQSGQVAARVVTALVVGLVGGFLGGLIGQTLYGVSGIFYVFGWTLTGTLIGVSIGAFEMIISTSQKKDQSGATKKMIKGVIGGTAGGILGGILSLLLSLALEQLLTGRDPNSLWSPTLWGFVALGMCIGLLIGLAQVILKEAWIKVEQGFRAGREMILSKENTTIGRAEGSDIALFGDMACEKLHARIVQQGNQYFLEDAGTSGGTFLNDRLIQGRTPLKSGDLIRVGKSVLCFRERQKRNQPAANV